MRITKAETKIGKMAYAVIVILFAVGFPLFLLGRANISEIEINIFTFLLSLLYIVVVSGFVLLIFNVEGVRLKALEIDKKTQGRLRKLSLFVVVLVAIDAVYISVKLYFELLK